MAELGIVKSFHAFHDHDHHPHNFKVEVVLEGEIDPETEYVAGLDFHKVIESVENIIEEITDKDLEPILKQVGFKTAYTESIAGYFLKRLKNDYPVKCVKVWEAEDRYAAIFNV